MDFNNSAIEMVIEPRIKDIGDGFSVRRLLPYMKKRMVGPFIFWDHMGPVHLKYQEESNVLSHPHIGLATITYLFSGEILHRDSIGSEQLIRPGEVNWMTAGSGISHSERSKAMDEKGMNLEGIQLWVALPKEAEEVDPHFVHFKSDILPKIKLGEHTLTLIAGQFRGQKSPVPVHSELFYLKGEMESNESLELFIEPHHEGAIYVVEGEIEIDGQVISKFHMGVLNSHKAIEIKAIKKSKLMILGGEPFKEKRFIWWNFVSSSEKRIEDAKKSWKDRTFPQTIKETDFVPLPT